ncbi:MAG: hydroxymethylbilane synthase [Bacteroidota bacterium]
MRLFKIVCRGSKLSLAQANIFKEKFMDAHDGVKVEIIVKETEGDTNQWQPLTEMEGKDFFTKDIQDYLLSGKADFAIHSMKDVSGDFFFKNNSYAVIERDEVHDVAVFNESVIDKLKKGERLFIGTSSPRRMEMASEFLLKALPSVNGQKVNISTSMIRGNVDTRLRKLDAGEYDGIILACAGLNRLLRDEYSKQEVSALLDDKKLMILPLLECPPAPGQGAIVAETSPGNEEAIRILRSLNVEHLAKAISVERKLANRYGSGCHQKFGVAHINTGDFSFTYAAGKDRNGKQFTEIEPKEILLKDEETISNEGRWKLSDQLNINLITSSEGIEQNGRSNQKNWVIKTGLWFDLAPRGMWVQGSLEGFGLKFIEKTIRSPLVAQNKV